MDSKYNFIKVLGAGSFGTTWLAENKGKKVAIKIFKMTKDQTHIDDFLWEVEMISGLLKACYPHAVCIVETYIQDFQPRLVMDYVDGESLESQMFSRWPRKINSLACDLINGIKIIHSHGIVHEDIKGANIMWDKNLKMYRYIDFGLACSKNYAKDGMVNLNRIRFPCGTYGTKYIASPDMEEARARAKPVSWNILQAHDYWAIGLELLRWHTFNPKMGMYYFNEYKKFAGKVTKQFIKQAYLDSDFPIYRLLGSDFIQSEIQKVKSAEMRKILGILLEFDGEKRFKNFKEIS
jgi:serine/threonine protein kinase